MKTLPTRSSPRLVQPTPSLDMCQGCMLDEIVPGVCKRIKEQTCGQVHSEHGPSPSPFQISHYQAGLINIAWSGFCPPLHFPRGSSLMFFTTGPLLTLFPLLIKSFTLCLQLTANQTSSFKSSVLSFDLPGELHSSLYPPSSGYHVPLYQSPYHTGTLHSYLYDCLFILVFPNKLYIHEERDEFALLTIVSPPLVQWPMHSLRS